MCSCRKIFSCVLDVKGPCFYIHPPEQKPTFKNQCYLNQDQDEQHTNDLSLLGLLLPQLEASKEGLGLAPYCYQDQGRKLTCPSKGGSGPFSSPI